MSVSKTKLQVAVRPEAARALRIFAARFGVRQGHALDGLLLLSKMTEPAKITACLNAVDTREGELVPDDEPEAQTINRNHMDGACYLEEGD